MEFVLRPLTPITAARALGSRLFGVVKSAQKKQVGEQTASEKKSMTEASERLLKSVMVSPKCGDKSDADADVVSFEDLNVTGYADMIFAEVTAKAGDVKDFPTSCEDSTGDASQPTSTPSVNGTDVAPVST